MLLLRRASPLAASRRSLATTTAHWSDRQHQRSPQEDVSYSETQIFKDNAKKWWSGKEFQLLRGMNELRVPLIRNGLLGERGRPKHDNNSKGPLEGFKIVDVGCGGGILSEPLARLGAQVLGVDPVHESIVEAMRHAQLDETLGNRLEYRNCNIEDVVADQKHVESFDAVVASEVLEHVHDVEAFLRHCTRAIRPNGSLFITTINQTPLSYLGVIVFGEYILQQLPKGTHTYEMFVNLLGLKIMLERMGYHLRLVHGFMYEPITGRFLWTPTTLTHYAIHAIKCSPPQGQTSGRSGGGISGTNYQQRRHYAANPKKQKGGKIQKPKVSVDEEEMLKVVPIDEFKVELASILSELKEQFDRNITSRVSLINVDNLEIALVADQERKATGHKRSNETTNLFQLKNVAQITRKGNSLIVIDLNAMPDAIKPTIEALSEHFGTLDPQIEGNTIYLPLSRMNREQREKLVEASKSLITKAKSEARLLFSSYSSKAKKQQGKKSVSEDLVREVIDYMQMEMHNAIAECDKMFQDKKNELLSV